MPRAPKKCGRDGCEVRTRSRYCDEHRPMNWQGDPRSSSTEHKAWRLKVLDRAGWSCQIRGPRCIGRATIADHIWNVKSGGEQFDPANGQAACTECHKVKTQAEAAAARALRRRGEGGPPPRG